MVFDRIPTGRALPERIMTRTYSSVDFKVVFSMIISEFNENLRRQDCRSNSPHFSTLFCDRLLG